MMTFPEARRQMFLTELKERMRVACDAWGLAYPDLIEVVMDYQRFAWRLYMRWGSPRTQIQDAACIDALMNPGDMEHRDLSDVYIESLIDAAILDARIPLQEVKL